MATKEKHQKQVMLAKLNLSEDLAATNNLDDITMAYEKLGEIIKRLEQSKDKTMQYLMENDTDLETLKVWANEQKECMIDFRKARDSYKQQLDEIKVQQQEEVFQNELQAQKRINDEQLKFRLQQEQELQEVMVRKQQAEEEWLKKKLELQKQSETTGHSLSPISGTTSTVKLEKYTITPFKRDYMDWLRFWNQFTVEVDETKILDMSKFHYLLELVKGKPRDDILGLPHSPDGYKEAKKILVENYGKDTKVHKALIKDLESLHTITSVHQLNLVNEFYNKLSRIVRSLTMGKLESAQSAVYTLMDKLGSVREVLVQKDDDWESWGLMELVEHLHKFVDRNPIHEGENEATGKQDWKKKGRWGEREKIFLGYNERSKQKQCIYCESEEHTGVKCTKVLEIPKRREILKQKNCCYNCATPGHRASACRARGCRKCGQKHHTSICQQKLPSSMDGMNGSKNEKLKLGIQQKEAMDEEGDSKTDKVLGTAQGNQSAVHPTLRVKIGDEEVRVMIDTGATSSYICSDIVTKLKLTPVRKEKRCIEQMYGTVSKVVGVYEVTLQSLAVLGYNIKIECINAEKGILTCLPNPRIAELKERNLSLRELNLFEEETTCESMPVHLILGVSDYQRIRTSGNNIILGTDPDTDPGAEFTMLGWTMFGGKQNREQPAKNFLLHTGQDEFEKLCSLDVLGVTDPINKEVFIHENFKQQLKKNGKLEKNGRLKEYDGIMREQLTTGIIEQVPENPSGNIVHYVPHQPVIRENAETTKMRIVYDCSSKTNDKVLSINDCLETGPSLQPLLFDILVRNHFRRYCVTGDVKKAFLQIMIRRCDRDAQHVLWYDDLECRNVAEYRFPGRYLVPPPVHTYWLQHWKNTWNNTRTCTLTQLTLYGMTSMSTISKVVAIWWKML